VPAGKNSSLVKRELLPSVGTARMLIVCLVCGSSLALNVSEHLDIVSPAGLAGVNVMEHGGHDIGTVGYISTGADKNVSCISTLPAFILT